MKKIVLSGLAVFVASSSLLFASPTTSSAATVSNKASIQIGDPTTNEATAQASLKKWSWGYSLRLSHLETVALIYAIDHGKPALMQLPWVSKLPTKLVNYLLSIDTNVLKKYDKAGSPGVVLELRYDAPHIRLKA